MHWKDKVKEDVTLKKEEMERERREARIRIKLEAEERLESVLGQRFCLEFSAWPTILVDNLRRPPMHYLYSPDMNLYIGLVYTDEKTLLVAGNNRGEFNIINRPADFSWVVDLDG